MTAPNLNVERKGHQLLVLANRGLDVLHPVEKVKRVRFTGLELPVEIPLPSSIVLGVHQQGTYPGDICCLRRALQSILEKGLAKPDALMLEIHRRARKNHHLHRALRDAFDHSGSRRCRFDAAHCQTAKADHNTGVATNIGLRAVGFLIDQRKTLQELIECGLTAIEGLNGVRTGQSANWLIRRRTQPSNPGLERRSRSFGLALTGWSSAA
jgi:hypothetical protein